jgi:predicted GNAT family acetyltransferase
MDTIEPMVKKNDEQKRFEIEVGGRIAVVEYIETKTMITYTHTEVPQAMEGQGIGSKLARTALDYARENDLQVMPLCPFIAAYIRRHPEYRDLVFRGKPRAEG